MIKWYTVFQTQIHTQRRKKHGIEKEIERKKIIALIANGDIFIISGNQSIINPPKTN